MKKMIMFTAAMFAAIVLSACTYANVLAPGEQKLVFPIAGYIGGGDCSADRATGDLYPEPDFYCLTGQGRPETVLSTVRRIIESVTATFFPTESSPTPSGTPQITPTTQTPVLTETPAPEPSETPVPTQKSGNGNSYGNDKPDNNPGDNSKFNGVHTRQEFEQVKDAAKTPKPEKTPKP